MVAKDVKGKAKLRYIPYKALVEIAKVREFGVMKYKDDTCWRQVDHMDFVEASARHVFKYMSGEKLDDESGLNHLSHALTSLVLAIAVLEDKEK